MPLVTLCGVPCVGKTAFCAYLAASLEKKGQSVVVIGEESLAQSKTELYGSSAQEKVTRASLKSAVSRAMSSSTVVIVDSLNYIKGYRYELYCIAREQRTSSCCVWVTLPDAEAERRHEARASGLGCGPGGADGCYPEAVFHDLRQRFEVPVVKNKWESPLFEVDMTEFEAGAAAAAASASGTTTTTTTSEPTVFDTAAMTAVLSESCAVPATVRVPAPVPTPAPAPKTSSFRRRIKRRDDDGGACAAPTAPLAVGGGGGDDSSVVSTATAATAATTATTDSSRRALWFSGSTVAREAVRGVGPEAASALIHAFVTDATLVLASAATVRLHHADAEMVYALDSVSQQVVARVEAHQREQLEGTPVVFPEFDRALTLNNRVALAELQRHRRQFVRVNTLYAPKDKGAIGAAFVDFLCNNI